MDVFLSFSRTDRALAQQLRSALAAAGYEVSDDQEIAAGETWRQVIGNQLTSSKCVVVLWTKESITSDWVMSEAEVGLSEGKLIPVLADNTVSPPLGFKSIHSLDLSSWKGDPSDPLLVYLLRAVERTTGKQAILPKGRFESPLRPEAEANAANAGMRVQVDKDKPYRKPFGARSTPIFIAHTTSDKPRIAPIVSVLVDSGFSVWIDKPHLLNLSAKVSKKVKGIEFGAGDWKEQIRRAVNKAKVVLALWSNDAIDARREQFYYEVYMALVQGKLCQARLDPLAPEKIGMPFTFDQIADLSDHEPRTYNPELDYMIAAFPKFRRRLL